MNGVGHSLEGQTGCEASALPQILAPQLLLFKNVASWVWASPHSCMFDVVFCILCSIQQPLALISMRLLDWCRDKAEIRSCVAQVSALAAARGLMFTVYLKPQNCWRQLASRGHDQENVCRGFTNPRLWLEWVFSGLTHCWKCWWQ